MRQTVVISEPFDAEQEISQFGLTLKIAQKVARAASAARSSTLAIDVAFAPGMLSHILGNRHLRLELLPLGWRSGRFNNVESVVNDDLGIQIIFQNVDMACNSDYSPKAISRKGAGSRRLVQDGLQGELWGESVKSPITINQAKSKHGMTPLVWIFCVSDDGKRLCAELSKPKLFEGDQFEDFGRRIFLVDERSAVEPEVTINPSSGDDDADFDIEVRVAKK